MIVNRDNIDSNAEQNFNFYINDIGLPIDPMNIQVYKEGLTYSYKTLRTKSSAKVISGNGVLHLSLSLIFDEESTLHLHRLVCQLKNSPFVQITNVFVTQSVLDSKERQTILMPESSAIPVYFTLSSFQISPMPESPQAYICELDLRYFNHAPYQSNLAFKKEYKTIANDKGEEYTFSIYKDEQQNNKILFNKIKQSNVTTNRKVNIFGELIKRELISESTRTVFAKDSDAYVRYCNFLQTESFIENFSITFEQLKEITEDTKIEGVGEPCLGFHDNRVPFSKRKELIKLLLDKTEVSCQYFDYQYLPFPSEMLKFFRNSLFEGIEQNDSLKDRQKKVKDNRKKFLDGELLSKEDENYISYQKIIGHIEANDLIPYSDIQDYSLIYYNKTNFHIKYDLSNKDGFEKSNDNVIASFSGMFRNILSTIPIVGQEFPTHQFLGSIEPVYQLTVLGKNTRLELAQTSPVNKKFENLRKTLQENSRNFKMVPDAGYFSMDSFITRLLGSYKDDMETNNKRLTLTSIETKTVEGSPGVDATSIRFCESKPYDTEELRPVFSSSSFVNKESQKKKLSKKVNARKQARVKKSDKKHLKTYNFMNWETRYINSDKWYSKIKKRRKDTENIITDHPILDANSYNFCKTVVDKLGDYLSWKDNLFGKSLSFFVTSGFDIIGTPRPGRPTMSQHFYGGAGDFSVRGLEKGDYLLLEAVVYYLWKNKYFKDEYFKTEQGEVSNSLFVKAYQHRNFIHIDKRFIVGGVKAEYKKENGKTILKNKPSINIEDNPICQNVVNFKYTTLNGTTSRYHGFYKDFIEVDGQGVNRSEVEQNVKEFLSFINYFRPNDEEEEQEVEQVEEEDGQEEESELDVASLVPQELRIARILDKKDVFEEKAFGGKEISRKTLRWSDLTKQQQQQIINSSRVSEEERKRITYDVVVVKEDISSKEIGGLDYLKVESSNKTKNTTGRTIFNQDSEIIIPRSSRNITQSNINEDEKIIVKMLEDFDLFASAILTEPNLYLEDPTDENIKAELERIKEELYGVEVVPFLYSNTLCCLLGFEVFNEAIKDASVQIGYGQSITGAFGLGSGLATAAIGYQGLATASGLALAGPIGLLALGILGGAYGLSQILTAGENAKSFQMQFARFSFNMNYGGKNIGERSLGSYFRSVVKINSKIENLLESQFTISNNADFLSIMESTIDSVEIMAGSQRFLQYVVLESPFLKSYNDYQKKLKTFTNVFAALGGFVNVNKGIIGDDIQEEAVLALNSDMLFAGEIKQLFLNIFDFPSEIYYQTKTLIRSQFTDDTYSKVIKSQNINDKISIELDNNGNSNKQNFVFNTNKKVLSQYLDTDSRKNSCSFVKNYYSGKPTSLYPFSVATRKELNDRKLGFLKNLYDELTKAVKSSKNLSLAYGLNKKTYVDFIDQIDENCYPDIKLPISPLGNMNLLHPGFYFWERNDNLKLKAKGEKNIKTIIENSFSFTEDLQYGLYTGDHNLVTVDKERYGTRTKVPLESYTIDISEGSPVMKVREQTSSNAKVKLKKENQNNIESPNPSINTDVSIESGGEEEIRKKLKTIGLGGKKHKESLETEKEKVAAKLKAKEGNTSELTDYLINQKDSLNITKEDLIKKAKRSFSSVLGNKESIKKAFPTFRLYLIEEDSNESDNLLVFDDFYSYNGIIDFTIHKSRKLPADTATVRVQNISGLLDGTKRNVIRDVDINGELLPEYEEAEQSRVQSIVLRPGVNAQIRAGYSSNPNELKILFCGRITEVAQSGSGDALELTLQSFGVELVSKKYGVSEADPTRAINFTSTQQLLSTLALSQELRHFGRYKRGRKFLVGENQQGYLDTTEYLTESWLQLNASNWVSNFNNEYYWYLATGAVLLEGLGAGGVKLLNVGNLGKSISSTVLKGGQGLVKGNARGASVALKALSGAIPDTIKVNILNGFKYVGKGFSKVKAGAKRVGDFIFPKFSYRSFYNQHRVAVEKALNETLVGGSITNIPKGLIRNNRFLGLGNIGPAIKRLFGRTAGRTVSREELTAIIARAEGAAGLVSRGLVPASSIGGGAFAAVFNTNVLGFRVFSNLSRTFLASYLIGGVIDLFSSLLGVVNKSFDKLLKHNLNPTKTKFLLSPQDDNIFAPGGDRYILKYNQSWTEQLFKEYIFNGVKTAVSYNMLPIYLLLKQGEDGYKKFKEFLKHPAVLGNKMLDARYKENIYNLNNTTIWEVFHEMYLRHPGWVYGVKQYGKGLEQRLFFGLPDQYYFAEPISNEEVSILNEIFFKVIEKQKVSIEDLRNITGKEVNKKDVSETIIELKNYFINKVSQHKKPYRQYHHITSENDIISNNLIVKSESTYNSIIVQYASKGLEGANDAGMHIDNTRTVNAHPFIPKDKVRQKSLVLPNIKGFGGAARYGIGALLDSAKEMYQGSILILGDPNIEPWDVCILEDNYSIMHGPIEVESVTHIFSYDTGFVTDIKPNALVTSNEAFSQPILDTAPVFIAQKKLLKDEINFNLLRNNDGAIDEEKIKKYVEDSITVYLSGSDSKIDKIIFNLQKSLGGGFERLKEKLLNVSGKNKSPSLKEETLINVYTEIIKKQIDERQFVSTGELTQGVDVSRYIENLIKVGSIGIGSIGAGGIVYSATSSALHSLGRGLKLTSSVKSPLLLGSLIGLGLGGNIFARDLSRLANDKLITGGLANSLFGEMLLARVNESNAIRVFPLSKDSKPLIASGYENIPPQYRFKKMFGTYINTVSDAAVSMSSRIRELEEMAEKAGYKEFDNDGIGFTKKVVVTIFGGFLGLLGNENYGHIAAATLANLASAGEISESAAWAYFAQDEFSRINNE